VPSDHSLSLADFITNIVESDFRYTQVKIIFENQPTILKAHSAARETIPQNVLKDSFLPIHPGAARYYREIGITIPDKLLAAKN
jgi:TRAP-type uncharacterized transport system substrate-binding protein